MLSVEMSSSFHPRSLPTPSKDTCSCASYEQHHRRGPRERSQSPQECFEEQQRQYVLLLDRPPLFILVMMTPFQRYRPLGYRSLFRRCLLLSQGERHHIEHFRKSLRATPNVTRSDHFAPHVNSNLLQALHHKSKPNLHFPSRMRILDEPNQCCYNQFVTLASQCGVRSGTTL